MTESSRTTCFMATSRVVIVFRGTLWTAPPAPSPKQSIYSRTSSEDGTVAEDRRPARVTDGIRDVSCFPSQSLGRAIYSRASILLLDNVLSTGTLLNYVPSLTFLYFDHTCCSSSLSWRWTDARKSHHFGIASRSALCARSKLHCCSW